MNEARARPDRPLISVIIPTLNEEQVIGRCLRHFRALAGRWEAIVADSGSADRTVEIASSAGATIVEHAPAGRGDAMNAGAQRAGGDILLFLHADTQLPGDAYRLVVDALANRSVAATGFRIRMNRPEWRYRLLGPLGTLRFRLQRTFFGDQAIAVRRDDFKRIGGYREPEIMEDVDLSRRLRKGGTLRLLPARVTTSARRFERGGVLRTLMLMSAFQIAYSLGIRAGLLKRWYAQIRETTAREEPPPGVVDLSSLRLRDQDGAEVQFADFQGRPILLVYLRWLG